MAVLVGRGKFNTDFYEIEKNRLVPIVVFFFLNFTKFRPIRYLDLLGRTLREGGREERGREKERGGLWILGMN